MLERIERMNNYIKVTGDRFRTLYLQFFDDLDAPDAADAIRRAVAVRAAHLPRKAAIATYLRPALPSTAELCHQHRIGVVGEVADVPVLPRIEAYATSSPTLTYPLRTPQPARFPG
jgi:hypothetical protein